MDTPMPGAGNFLHRVVDNPCSARATRSLVGACGYVRTTINARGTSERSERVWRTRVFHSLCGVICSDTWQTHLSLCMLRVSTLPDKGEESLVTTLLDRERGEMIRFVTEC